MIVCSCFRVSWFHLRAFSWLPAVIMQKSVPTHRLCRDARMYMIETFDFARKPYVLAGNTSKFADFDTFGTLKFAVFDAFNTSKFADFDIFSKKSLKIKELLVSLQQYKR